MRFTLDQLATFCCIARVGSFNAAARHLNLTQPTVSQRIRELETSLGQALFLRRGAGVQLTLQGQSLLISAKEMLAMSDRIAGQFAHALPLNGNLRFGTTDTFAHVCLVEMITRVEDVYPGIKIAVCVDNSATVSRLLQDGQIDIAIISEPNFGEEIVAIELGFNQMAWVAGSGMNFPQQPITAQGLAEYHLVLTAPPSRLHNTVMAWLSDSGVAPSRISTCNNLNVIADMVASGLAVGALPTSALHELIEEQRIRVLDVAPPLAGHRAALCYRLDNVSSGLREVSQIVQDLVGEKGLFMENPTAPQAS